MQFRYTNCCSLVVEVWSLRVCVCVHECVHLRKLNLYKLPVVMVVMFVGRWNWVEYIVEHRCIGTMYFGQMFFRWWQTLRWHFGCFVGQCLIVKHHRWFCWCWWWWWCATFTICNVVVVVVVAVVMGWKRCWTNRMGWYCWRDWWSCGVNWCWKPWWLGWWDQLRIIVVVGGDCCEERKKFLFS